MEGRIARFSLLFFTTKTVFMDDLIQQLKNWRTIRYKVEQMVAHAGSREAEKELTRHLVNADKEIERITYLIKQ